MDIKDSKFYGTTTVGEKGQVVLPAELRRELKIKAGDKLAVLLIKKMDNSGIVLVDSKILTSVIDDIFSKNPEEADKIKKSR
ncbi:MAG: AbrB/MazE/SpoVT family DNA-binding domain-containing protein [Actinobacteria bacterium]|nr:AbrB/MazE/SpoVT family DNA-binding domain-containing protein [Actinomycetota bacterium]